MIAAYSVAATSIQPDLSLGAWGLASRDLLPYLARQAADAYEKQGVPGLEAFLREISREGKLRAYLLDSTGRSVTGAPPPDKSFWLATAHDAKESPGNTAPRLANTRSFVTIQSASGARYTFIITLSWRPFQRVQELGANGLWLPFFATLLASGLVCYLLARHIARPVVLLRDVTRRFASGQLHARFADSDLFRYRDEFGELGREFNAMASRVQSLLQTQKQLLGDISHELGAPISRLRLAVELATKKLGPDASPHLSRMEREADRLAALSWEVLNLLRAAAPKAPDAFQTIAISNLLREITEDASFEAAPRGVRVELLGADSPLELSGNRELLRRAFENVLRNAVKYTRPQSVVSVEVCPPRTDSMATIRVMDQGSGVEEADLPRIFDPFFRSGFARDRESGGFGLGLAIAHAAIRSHAGTISAENRLEGGLTVEIHLPLVSPTVGSSLSASPHCLPAPNA
ncbi:ATP-binding protein [Nostoc sp. NIES-2111]